MGRVDHDALHRFTAELLDAQGAPDDIAEGVADSLTAAEVRGHPSHGVQLLPAYMEWAEEGPLDPAAEYDVVEERSGTALIEGNHGYGHPTARDATALAAAMTDDQGAATVGIRHGTHMGRMGWFAEQAAEAGLGFMAFTNMTSGRPVAPAGSAQRRFGTNPVTFGLPSFDAAPHPIVFDIATSQVAYGKVNVRHAAGEVVSPDWTVDESGDPVTDTDAFNEEGVGALAPLGGQTAGYKGTGLMLMVELFAATMSDSAVTPQADAGRENAAYFVTFDPLAFTTRDAHEERIEALATYLDDTEYSDDVAAGAGSKVDRAYLPGRREYDTRQEYEAEGVPVSDPLRETLADLGRENGLPEGTVAPLDPA